jgi:uncharacterized membrane protein
MGRYNQTMRTGVALSLLLVAPAAFALRGSEYVSPIGGIILAALLAIGFFRNPLKNLWVIGIPHLVFGLWVVITLKFGGWAGLTFIAVAYVSAVMWESHQPRDSQ